MATLGHKLRVGGFNELSTVNTKSIGLDIFFQGCSIKCPGCHNPELQDFGGGIILTVDEVLDKVVKHREWYKAVALLGGEPLDQPMLALSHLILGIESLGLEVWLYTGYPADKIPSFIKKHCSVIVAGKYVEELKTGGFPASSNQQIIDNREGVAK